MTRPKLPDLTLQPRIRVIIEALYSTGPLAELLQLQCKQLVPDTEGRGGYVTL